MSASVSAWASVTERPRPGLAATAEFEGALDALDTAAEVCGVELRTG